jgi:hypothetical protein
MMASSSAIERAVMAKNSGILAESLEDLNEQKLGKPLTKKKEGYHLLKISDLKELLKKRELALSGNKDTLVDRLERSDSQKVPSSGKKVEEEEKKEKSGVYNKLSVTDLQKVLTNRGLSHTGNKAALVDRLALSDSDISSSNGENVKKTKKKNKETEKTEKENKLEE